MSQRKRFFLTCSLFFIASLFVSCAQAPQSGEVELSAQAEEKKEKESLQSMQDEFVRAYYDRF